MSVGAWAFLIIGVLGIVAVSVAVWQTGRHRTPQVEDPFCTRMLEGLARTNALLEQMRKAAENHTPGPAVSAAPCMCHILWHATDASAPGLDDMETNIHLLTFTDWEERIWIDARVPQQVRFLDADPGCFADAGEMSESAILRVFADYHVDVHYPETREWMRQVMRRAPQGAFVFQTPADNITIGGIVYMREGYLLPLSAGEVARVKRILKKAHLQICPEHENLNPPPAVICPVIAEAGQSDVR